MRLKRIFQDYFTFSKKERNGIVVLLAIIILFAMINHFIFLIEKPGQIDVEKFLAEIAEFEKQKSIVPQVGVLFEFNPNTIDSLSLDSLMLPDQVKRNLLKFRIKGGRISKPEDFRKIYGMSDSVFLIIEKFIRIEQSVLKPENSNYSKRKAQYYPFDPNNCSKNDWINLGLNDKQVKTVERYREAIGGFSSKVQFSKTYGIEKSLMDSLLKYIVIESKCEHDTVQVLVDKKMIELNSADSIKLMDLPEIGRVLSRRIIKYRDSLGGFYSGSQLLEVYGITSETYQKISCCVSVDTLAIRRMNINLSSFAELSAHPYIRNKLAREIVNYRSKYGPIENLSDLCKSNILTLEKFEKMRPYLATKNQEFRFNN